MVRSLAIKFKTRKRLGDPACFFFGAFQSILGDVPLLDYRGRSFYRWLRQAGVLLFFGAIIVGTIMWSIVEVHAHLSGWAKGQPLRQLSTSPDIETVEIIGKQIYKNPAFISGLGDFLDRHIADIKVGKSLLGTDIRRQLQWKPSNAEAWRMVSLRYDRTPISYGKSLGRDIADIGYTYSHSPVNRFVGRVGLIADLGKINES
jgi:hypothetical protein